MKCPLKNDKYSMYIDCYGTGCNFADDEGNCLIRAALITYINQGQSKPKEKKDYNLFTTFGDK